MMQLLRLVMRRNELAQDEIIDTILRFGASHASINRPEWVNRAAPEIFSEIVDDLTQILFAYYRDTGEEGFTPDLKIDDTLGLEGVTIEPVFSEGIEVEEWEILKTEKSTNGNTCIGIESSRYFWNEFFDESAALHAFNGALIPLADGGYIRPKCIATRWAELSSTKVWMTRARFTYPEHPARPQEEGSIIVLGQRSFVLVINGIQTYYEYQGIPIRDAARPLGCCPASFFARNILPTQI